MFRVRTHSIAHSLFNCAVRVVHAARHLGTRIHYHRQTSVFIPSQPLWQGWVDRVALGGLRGRECLCSGLQYFIGASGQPGQMRPHHVEGQTE